MMMDGGEHKNGFIGFMTLSFGCKDQYLFFYWFGWYVKTKWPTIFATQGLQLICNPNPFMYHINCPLRILKLKTGKYRKIGYLLHHYFSFDSRICVSDNIKT